MLCVVGCQLGIENNGIRHLLSLERLRDRFDVISFTTSHKQLTTDIKGVFYTKNWMLFHSGRFIQHIGLDCQTKKSGRDEFRRISELTSSEAPAKQFLIPIQMQVLMESNFRLKYEP
jgi:hypothetical protein